MNTVLFIAKFFAPVKGGSTRWYEEIYRRYPEGSVVVLTQKTRGWATYDAHSPLKIFRMNPWGSATLHPKWLKIHLSILWKAFVIVLSKRIGVIHGDIVLPSGLIAFCVSSIFRIPYVLYAHGEEITQYSKLYPERYVISFVYRHASAVIANSQFTRDLLLRLKVKDKKISVINPGVDTIRFCPGIDVGSLKRELYIENKLILLTVGRLTERKGHNQVIKALPLLLKTFPDIVYIIAGTGTELENLKKLADDLGVSDSVQFLGHVDDDLLPSIYNLADVFIMANFETNLNDVEGFGMVFIEANACGKPVIGGRSGGTESAIIHEKTGLLVNANNIDEICKAVIRLLSDKVFAKELGEWGRQRAVSLFGWNNCLKNIQRLGKDRV